MNSTYTPVLTDVIGLFGEVRTFVFDFIGESITLLMAEPLLLFGLGLAVTVYVLRMTIRLVRFR